LKTTEKQVVDEQVRWQIRGDRELVCPIVHDEHICLDDTIMVSASAGSGKTSVLVDRMVALVRRGAPLDSIVAITFTRKAAGELQERFFSQLLSTRKLISLRVQEDAHWKDEWERELQFVDRAIEEAEHVYIGTIHAFCAQILRLGALELGIPPEFEQIGDQDEKSLRRSFWSAYLHESSTSESSDLDVIQDAKLPFDWLFDMFGTLSKNEAVEFELSHKPKPDPSSAFVYLVEFVQQIAPRIPPSDNPDTFLTEMERMVAMLSTNGSFDDYFQIDLLKMVASLKKGGSKPGLDITFSRWGDRNSEPYKLAQDLKKGCEDLGLPLALDHFIDEQVRPVIEQWDYWLHDRALTFTINAVESYRSSRLSTGKLTYDDLLTQSLRLLQQSPSVRTTLQKRYQHILVDEFQDTDPTQAAMLFSLASSDLNETDWSQSTLMPGRLFLVGDDKQSIYRFRKADFQAFQLVKDSIRSQGGRDLHLTMNFRSDQRICEWVNQSLAPRFTGSSVPYQAPWEDLKPFKGILGLDPIVHFKIAKKSKGVRLEHQTRGEAIAIAKHILELVAEPSNHLDYGSFMILVRRHAPIPYYVSALMKAGIPFGITGGRAHNISGVLNTLGNLFNALYNSDDGPALIATLRGPFYGVSDQDLFTYSRLGNRIQDIIEYGNQVDMSTSLGAAAEQLKTLRKLFTAKPPHQSLEQCLSITGIEALLRNQADADVVSGMLQRVLELFKDWETKGYSFGKCVEEFNLYRDGSLKLESFSESLPFGNCVRLMTIHQAKGLQAPVVFLADVGGGGPQRATLHTYRKGPRVVGKLPIMHETHFGKTEKIAPFAWEEAVAEEKLFDEAETERLVYVAATRAERQLIISTNEVPKTGSWDVLSESLTEGGSGAIPVITVTIDPIMEASEVTFEERSPEEIALPEPWSEEHIKNSISRLSLPSWVYLRPSEIEDDGQPLDTSSRGFKSNVDSNAPSGIGMEYGSAMHAVFEALVGRRKEDLSDDDLANWARSLLEPQFNQINTKPLVDLGTEAILTFLQSAVWKQIKVASRVLTEVPFTVSDTQNGQIQVTSGVVDLAFLVGTSWTIVDYKTDQRDEDGLLQRHSNQLGAYHRTWSKIFEDTQSCVFIWSTHLGKMIQIETGTEKLV